MVNLIARIVNIYDNCMESMWTVFLNKTNECVMKLS